MYFGITDMILESLIEAKYAQNVVILLTLTYLCFFSRQWL